MLYFSFIYFWLSYENISCIIFVQLGESSLYILNNSLKPSARLEFISRYAGKVKIKFDAYAFDEKTEIVFRNISNPEQLIIPLISNSLSHYEYNKYIDVSAENTLALEVYSSSALDTLLILDNIKMVIMK